MPDEGHVVCERCSQRSTDRGRRNLLPRVGSHRQLDRRHQHDRTADRYCPERRETEGCRVGERSPGPVFRNDPRAAALDGGGGASKNGAMTLHVSRIPLGLHPLMAEARRRMRQRRLLVGVLVIALTAGVLGSTLTLRGPSGPVPAGRDSVARTSRVALRVRGQGVLSIGKTRLRCVSQAASEIVCTDTTSVRRGSAVSERPRSGWHFVRWSGACQGASHTCRVHNSRLASVGATFRQ